jgi:hypothetical protein
MPRTESSERKAVVAYIRSRVLAKPLGDAEEHVNDVLRTLAGDIERGNHQQRRKGGL